MTIMHMFAKGKITPRDNKQVSKYFQLQTKALKHRNAKLKGALSRYLSTFNYKKLKAVSSHQLNSKTNDLVLLFKTI